MRAGTIVIVAPVALAILILAGDHSSTGQVRAQQAVKKVDMGDSIGISRDRRLFVADREHHRMQVFDENGRSLTMWPTGYNSAVLAHIVTQDDFVWVADWTTDRLVKYDLDGHYILDIGSHGALPGQFDGVHQIHVDSARNLYVTEVSNDRSQMFRPKPNADPNRLIGPMAVVNSRPAR